MNRVLGVGGRPSTVMAVDRDDHEPQRKRTVVSPERNTVAGVQAL